MCVNEPRLEQVNLNEHTEPNAAEQKTQVGTIASTAAQASLIMISSSVHGLHFNEVHSQQVIY